jgi:hypothetical protein
MATDQDLLLYTEPDTCCGDHSSSSSSSSTSTDDSKLQADGGNNSNREINDNQATLYLPQMPDHMLELVVACNGEKETCSNPVSQKDAAVSIGTTGSCSALALDAVDCADAGTGGAAQTDLSSDCTPHHQQQNDTMPSLDVAAKSAADATLCNGTAASISAGSRGLLGNDVNGSEVAKSGVNPAQAGCSVFFARVPPTVPYESIQTLFERFGKVKLLNLFRPWASAKTSKVGCLQAVQCEATCVAVACRF